MDDAGSSGTEAAGQESGKIVVEGTAPSISSSIISNLEESECDHEESGFSVLIVDDDNTCRALHKATVRKQLGITSMVAKNGKEAVNLYRAGNFFNIVFMDKEMPVMNGPQATKELREMGVQSMIVGLTSDDEDKARREFLAAGLDKCLKKPLTPAMVEAIVDEYDNKYNDTCIYCGVPHHSENDS